MYKKKGKLPRVPKFRRVFREEIYGVNVRYELHKPRVLDIPKEIDGFFWIKNHEKSQKAFRKWFVFENKKDFEHFFMEHQGTVPKLVPWREGKEMDWVLADDGGVCEIIRRNLMNKGKKYGGEYVRTIVGSFMYVPQYGDRKDIMPFFMDTDFNIHPNRSTFSGVKYYNIEDYLKKKKFCNVKEKIFAHDVAHGVPLRDAYRDCYPRDESNPTTIEKRALLLYNQERIQKEVSKNLEQIFEAKGINHEWIIEKMKTYMEKMEKDGDIRGAREALKDLARGIGTFESNSVKQVQGGLMSMVQRFTLDGDVEELENEMKQIENGNE